MTDQFDFNRFMDEFADTRRQASVDAVFGTPVESEGKTVIPIASAMYGFGMGAGISAAPASTEGKKAASSGAGGGSGYVTRPMAVAVIDAQGVRIESITNEERIALSGMLLGAWAIFWVARVLLRLASKIR